LPLSLQHIPKSLESVLIDTIDLSLPIRQILRLESLLTEMNSSLLPWISAKELTDEECSVNVCLHFQSAVDQILIVLS
jgi:hypothetical protein